METRELEIRLATLESKLRKHASQHLIGGNDELRPTQHFRLAGTKLDLAGITYTVPSADGSASQVLSTNGSRTLSWAAAGGLLGAGNWKSIYSNASGVATGLVLGADDTFLVSTGAAAAPEMRLISHSDLPTEQKLVAASRADYTTIASAYTAASAGWKLQLEGATVNITAAIEAKANVQLLGTGHTSLVNTNAAITTPILRNVNHGVAGDDSILIQDMAFAGTLGTYATWQDGKQEIGLQLEGILNDPCYSPLLRNLKINSIQNHLGAQDYLQYGLFDNIYAQDLGGGWEVSNSEYVTFRDCTVKEACFFGGADAFRFDAGTARSAIFGCRAIDVGNPRLTFTGSGLNDMAKGESAVGVTFNDGNGRTYRIKIDGTGSPNTFTWSKNGGSTWEATGVAITGVSQTLQVGGESDYITVTFGATTGHTLNDYWQVAYSGSNRGFVAAAGSDAGGAVSLIQMIGNLAHRFQDLGFIVGGTKDTNQSAYCILSGNIAYQSTVNATAVNGAGGAGLGGSKLVSSIYSNNIAARVQGKPGLSFGFDPGANITTHIDNLILGGNITDECSQGGILLDCGVTQTNPGTSATTIDRALVHNNMILGGTGYSSDIGIRHLNSKTADTPASATQSWNDNLWEGNIVYNQDSHGMVFMGTRGIVGQNLVRSWGSGAYGLYMETQSTKAFVNGNYFSDNDDPGQRIGIVDVGTANIYGLNVLGTMRATQYAALPSGFNEIKNGSFEAWAVTVPQGWAKTGGGASATVTQESAAGNFIIGSYALKMANDSGAQEVTFTISNWADFKGKYITVSCWVKTSTASSASVKASDGVTTPQSPKHTGGGGWELLSVTTRVSTSASQLVVSCRLEAVNNTACYFDGFMVTKSAFVMEYSPDLRTHTHADGSEGAQLDWDTCWADAVHSHASDAEGGGTISLPANGLTVGTTQLVTSGGNVGIGTTPGVKLDVLKDDTVAIRAISSDATHYTGYAADSGTVLGRLWSDATYATNAGAVLIGAESSHQMILRTGNMDRITISTTGAVRMHAYGAGTATFDASGNITSVSDARFKDRIGPLPYGLSEILQLKPIQHGYNELSGLERDHLYGGFVAQDVQALMPLAVGADQQGYLTLSDRPILGAAINAIKELEERISKLECGGPCVMLDTRGD